MSISVRYFAAVFVLVSFFAGVHADCCAQSRRARQQYVEVGAKAVTQAQQNEKLLEYIVEDGDTIYIDVLRASKVYAQLPRQKGKQDWSGAWRLQEQHQALQRSRGGGGCPRQGHWT